MTCRLRRKAWLSWFLLVVWLSAFDGRFICRGSSSLTFQLLYPSLKTAKFFQKKKQLHLISISD
jgi:hypothetical protein